MITQLKSLQERREREGEEGFTLIELLIVIVVLGILAAVVVFALGSVTGNAKASSCNADAKTVAVAVTTYDAYPPANCGTGGNPACTIGYEVNGTLGGDITPGTASTYAGGTYASDLVSNSDLNTWPGSSNGYSVSLATETGTTPDAIYANDSLANTTTDTSYTLLQAAAAGDVIIWVTGAESNSNPGTGVGQIYNDASSNAGCSVL